MVCTIETLQFYCTTSDIHFGPTFESYEEGVAFAQWLPKDPRTIQRDLLEWLLEVHRERVKLRTALENIHEKYSRYGDEYCEEYLVPARLIRRIPALLQSEEDK